MFNEVKNKFWTRFWKKTERMSEVRVDYYNNIGDVKRRDEWADLNKKSKEAIEHYAKS